MQLTIDGFANNGAMPAEFAFGKPDPDSHIALSDNRNPRVSWRDAPSTTRSFVLVCVDVDAPARADDANKTDRRIPIDFERADFIHWVMVDIPPTLTEIGAGSCSNGITPRGKQTPPGPSGSRQGLNDYTGWFADDADMNGNYFGYDGPCPPFNDERRHHYHFRLYATDLDRCPVDGAFTATDVMAAINGHVLAQADYIGSYATNPDA